MVKLKKLSYPLLASIIYASEWGLAFGLAITGNAGLYLTFACIIALLALIFKR